MQVMGELWGYGLCDYKVPEPASLQSWASWCGDVADSPGGRCYGWLTAKLEPRGFLVGHIMPDPMTGVLQGSEFFWWVRPQFRGRASLELAAAFETDCKKAGCKRVIFGFSQFSQPEKTEQLYQKLGFQKHSTAVYKDI